MSERAPETPIEPVAPPGEESAAAITPTEQPWAPSKEEFDTLVSGQRDLQAMVGRLFEEPVDEADLLDDGNLDLSNLDPRQLAALMGQVADSRLEGIAPYIRNAAQDQGKAKMKEIFTAEKATLGDFDEELAERTAFYFFDQSGDPEGSVKAAAKYAADVRKAERDAWEKETAERATRRGFGAGDEPGVTGGATPGAEKFKTYDEVIDAYAGQSEV
jgi:hypothetical protein